MPFEQVKGLKHRSNAIFGAYNLPRPANLPDLLALMLSATVGSLDVAKQGVDLTVELHSNPRTVSVRLLHKSEAAWERQYQDDVTLADAMRPWTEAKGLSLNGLRLWQRTSVLSSAQGHGTRPSVMKRKKQRMRWQATAGVQRSLGLGWGGKWTSISP